jgi:hypothetical protein
VLGLAKVQILLSVFRITVHDSEIQEVRSCNIPDVTVPYYCDKISHIFKYKAKVWKIHVLPWCGEKQPIVVVLSNHFVFSEQTSS